MCLFGGYSIAPQFSQGVITKLVRWSGISKPQLLDGKVRLDSKQTAVLAPHMIILITVASICDVCALASNSQRMCTCRDNWSYFLPSESCCVHHSDRSCIHIRTLHKCQLLRMRSCKNKKSYFLHSKSSCLITAS